MTYYRIVNCQGRLFLFACSLIIAWDSFKQIDNTFNLRLDICDKSSISALSSLFSLLCHESDLFPTIDQV